MNFSIRQVGATLPAAARFCPACGLEIPAAFATTFFHTTAPANSSET